MARECRLTKYDYCTARYYEFNDTTMVDIDVQIWVDDEWLMNISYRSRRGGYHIAVQEIEDAVCPRRIGFHATNAVGLNLACYESP